MSRFTDELRDPWGLLLGATAGGAAWAVSVHPAGAAFVGVAVWLTKAGIATFQRKPKPQLRVTPGSSEADWMRRATIAAEAFADMSAAMAEGPIAERVVLMRPKADDAMATLQRLAEHASQTGTALGRLNPGFLQNEHDRLQHQRRMATPEVAAELDRSLASLNSQREVFERLSSTRARLIARLESGTLGLEGLVARVVELSAMSATGSLERTKALDELAGELEGIRQGLHETEEITRRALDQ
ncbi:hypothetical protein ACIBG8_22325 [Nonomuraea sp. NPDC050556]|uniref:hypothetical protein n=1 Tax=Nonomuraea sp. NPDC050556 TaxID=3364369 RepID=UPI00379F3800